VLTMTLTGSTEPFLFAFHSFSIPYNSFALPMQAFETFSYIQIQSIEVY